MTTRPATGPGPSTETARYVADMLAARGYPSVAETVRDVADEIDDDHIHQRPDGLWTTEPIPAALAGHITGAQAAEPRADHRTAGQFAYEAWADARGISVLESWDKLCNPTQKSWEIAAAAVIARHESSAPTESEHAESSNPHKVTYTAPIDAKSVARAVSEAVDNLLVLDEEFGHEVLLRLTRGAVREDEAPSLTEMFTDKESGARTSSIAPRGTTISIAEDTDIEKVMAAFRKAKAELGDRSSDQRAKPDNPQATARPVAGQFYRLREDVDRCGVPTDADRVRVLHTLAAGQSVMVDWPDLPDGPAHQSTMIPVSHLVVTP